MIKRSLTALSALAILGLAACGDTVEEGDTTVVEANTPEPAYVPAPSAAPADADNSSAGDSLSISEKGISATMNDGGTTISADIDGNPSFSVERN
ncbi:hypothetical protein GCM10009127_26600 [Alteraurantiacibacter aestuarii]|uniref:Uncharacterized protein n=1 Tax=Alteraurantiacibacter aestuarii TaxID=650004 RepID=A0A844ZJZ9_9SPHN|nr:hypothetical protein [Alteraurantiacibacter aestuarii]MXO88771.1 hypothetical protein [Alteraurantiacibacter aestuarii]